MQKGTSYSLGLETHPVPMAMFRENRERLIARFEKSAEGTPEGSVVLLRGGKAKTRHETDHEHLFRQESFFHWTFGVADPDCFGAIDLKRRRAILFIPRLPAEYAVWMGKIASCEDYTARYEVEETYYVDEIDAVLSKLNTKIIYTLHGLNSDSGNYAKPATFPGIEKYRVDNGRLWPEMVECRVIKTPMELDVLRYVCRISSEAHVAVMKQCKPGMMEYQLEALFQHEVYSRGGCRHVAYTCICGSGHHGSILHYGHAGAPNDKQLADGDLMLLDMGGEYQCYGADITCSYPANGRFTEKQKVVYNTVLAAQQAVFAAMKPGVAWMDMHALAYRTTLQELARHGLVKGDVDAMMDADLGAIFMPHGLGHFLGIDTHDVGGYSTGAERSTRPGFKSLRANRSLEAGMVLTVEPGVYFIDPLLDKAIADDKQKQFINVDKVNEFRGIGGVRLEDDVIVTADGIENMTKCPRTVEEIEAIMAEGRKSH